MQPPPILKEAELTLRPPRAGDAEAFLLLGNDPEIHRMFGGGRAEFRPATAQSAAERVTRMLAHPYCWVIERGGVIGEARLDRVDLRDRRASFAIGILDPASLGRGYGPRAARLVLGFAFGTLGLHRISLRVVAYNVRAIRAYEKCGFVAEGREREAACVDGEWHDDVMMGLIDRDFRRPV
jgi:RimJ/RimL family protein N-acetyltransferase